MDTISLTKEFSNHAPGPVELDQSTLNGAMAEYQSAMDNGTVANLRGGEPSGFGLDSNGPDLDAAMTAYQKASEQGLVANLRGGNPNGFGLDNQQPTLENNQTGPAINNDFSPG